MTEPLELKFHRIVCSCGRVSYTGDKEHHVTKGDRIYPQNCHECGSAEFKVWCPPGCKGLLTYRDATTWPPIVPRTAWARILEEED